ncbi:hypothetical protein B0H13DRAFT_1853812 [Mycena leptocephala]|nr:hypothetical protein B0H13DRAFT_1853812 [Mycena leptocephala]
MPPADKAWINWLWSSIQVWVLVRTFGELAIKIDAWSDMVFKWIENMSMQGFLAQRAWAVYDGMLVHLKLAALKWERVKKRATTSQQRVELGLVLQCGEFGAQKHPDITRDIVHVDLMQSADSVRRERFAKGRPVYQTSKSAQNRRDTSSTSGIIMRKKKKRSTATARPDDGGKKRRERDLQTEAAVYLGYAKQSNDKLALHKALLFLGDAAISKEDDTTAHSLFTVALGSFSWMSITAELNVYCVSGILPASKAIYLRLPRFGQKLVRFLKGHHKLKVLHRSMPDLRNFNTTRRHCRVYTRVILRAWSMTRRTGNVTGDLQRPMHEHSEVKKEKNEGRTPKEQNIKNTAAKEVHEEGGAGRNTRYLSSKAELGLWCTTIRRNKDGSMMDKGIPRYLKAEETRMQKQQKMHVARARSGPAKSTGRIRMEEMKRVGKSLAHFTVRTVNMDDEHEHT